MKDGGIYYVKIIETSSDCPPPDKSTLDFFNHFGESFRGRKNAFTLAEVLITLGIIGVVAALTLPSLIQKHQEKITVTKLKKAYSVVSQAYLRAEQENGDIGTWGFHTGERIDKDGKLTEVTYKNEQLFWSKLLPYMNVNSVCFNDITEKCTTNIGFELNGKKRNKKSTTYIRLNDGTVFMGGWIQAPSCPVNTYCGDFYIDINSPENPPNTIGKDIFYFIIMKNKIVPWGNEEQKFNTRCLNNGDGYGCTAWVIYNENMDYLHCDDLSWNGKRKCK